MTITTRPAATSMKAGSPVSDMKIGRIETFVVPPRWLFVRVESADGAVGWGEASLEGHAEAVDGAFESLRDRFVGQDPRRIEDIWQVGYRGGFYRGGPVLMSALAGLEQALWDLKGRAVGLPAWEMLGGIGTPRVFDDVARRVEAAQGLGMDVGLDFHGRVHRPLAKQLAKALDPLGLLFIEEPLLSENPEGLAQIAAMVSTPIALGERLYGRWEFKPFFEIGAVDIIQPDLSHAGGLLECRKIAAMAEAYDVAVAPHCPLGPLALGACLQIAACTPNHAIQEISLGIHYNVGGHDLLNFCSDKQVLTPVGGYLPVPEGPGLGIDIDEAAVREADKDRHRWRNPVWRTKDGSFAEW